MISRGPTHYDTLGVHPDAGTADIKRAFRGKAKQLHPDVVGKDTTQDGMRSLLVAYRVLCNPRLRAEYDLALGPRLHRRTQPSFDYRDLLKSDGSDAGCSKLIFFDLLHSRENEAVELHNLLVRTRAYSIERHLDREDFMDCAFLLAEEYEKRGERIRSVRLLSLVLEYEYKKPYFRHFTEEVFSRLRSLVISRPVSHNERDELLEAVGRLAELELPAREKAFYCRRAAELHLERDDVESASDYVRRGLKLDSRMAGAKKLLRKVSV